MLSKVYSAAINGIEAIPVTIETVVDKGVHFTIVGLPDTAVKESHERIISAIRMSGMRPPHQKVLVNLSTSRRRAPVSISRWRWACFTPTALFRQTVSRR